MSVKVGITITMDDSGQISFAASSKNLVTILGLIEIAKRGFTEKLASEQSSIVVPQVGIN